MDKKNCNCSVECTVKQCANHSNEGDYCVLDRIKIGTHEKNPTVVQCTDCESFVLGTSSCRSCRS